MQALPALPSPYPTFNILNHPRQLGSLFVLTTANEVSDRWDDFWIGKYVIIPIITTIALTIFSAIELALQLTLLCTVVPLYLIGSRLVKEIACSIFCLVFGPLQLFFPLRGDLIQLIQITNRAETNQNLDKVYSLALEKALVEADLNVSLQLLEINIPLKNLKNIPKLEQILQRGPSWLPVIRRYFEESLFAGNRSDLVSVFLKLADDHAQKEKEEFETKSRAEESILSETYLMFASSLISKKIYIYSQTTLCSAARFNQARIITELFAARSYQKNELDTALIEAVDCRKGIPARLLLEKGAEARFCYSIFTLASDEKYRVEIARYLNDRKRILEEDLTFSEENLPFIDEYKQKSIALISHYIDDGEWAHYQVTDVALDIITNAEALRQAVHEKHNDQVIGYLTKNISLYPKQIAEYGFHYDDFLPDFSEIFNPNDLTIAKLYLQEKVNIPITDHFNILNSNFTNPLTEVLIAYYEEVNKAKEYLSESEEEIKELIEKKNDLFELTSHLINLRIGLDNDDARFSHPLSRAIVNGDLELLKLIFSKMRPGSKQFKDAMLIAVWKADYPILKYLADKKLEVPKDDLTYEDNWVIGLSKALGIDDDEDTIRENGPNIELFKLLLKLGLPLDLKLKSVDSTGNTGEKPWQELDEVKNNPLLLNAIKEFTKRSSSQSTCLTYSI